MSTLPQDLYSAAQVRELDRRAIEDYSIPGFTLMTRAASASFLVLRERWPAAKRIIVLCGKGNNGGDGYVVASLALRAGLQASVLQLGDSPPHNGDAAKAYQQWLDCGGRFKCFDGTIGAECDVLVDAILGTGLERTVKGDWAKAIECMNDHTAPVLAVDIPSGLHADSGAILGIATRAEVTISFIGLKPGLFTGQGPDRCGEVVYERLEVPDQAFQELAPVALRMDQKMLQGALPKRPRSAHKGSFGAVLVIGGSPGMSGAVTMAAEAALRVGAGLVSVATHPDHAALISTHRPEIMSHGVIDGGDLVALLEKASVIVIGPGLGQTTWAVGLLEKVMEYSIPLVVDADALNLLARDPIKRSDWVLTPHPGEAARLLETTAHGIESDRFNALGQLRQRYGGTVVLKGSGSLISNPADGAYLCHAGNPGMASGGMGDVLSGVIAGLIAQGLGMNEAARTGVCLHAVAADRATRQGERGTLASDLFPELRKLVNE